MNDAAQMILDAGDYEGMFFIVHQTGGWIELGAGFLPVIFATVNEAQAWCENHARHCGGDVTLQPAKEHNGRRVGSPVSGKAVRS